MTADGSDASHSRALHLEVEVPGAPEQVWDAIATGPGVTAWMQPTEVEEREGGTFSYDTGRWTRRGPTAFVTVPARQRGRARCPGPD